MEPGSGRKRPWEEENPTDIPPARPLSTTALRESLIAPLPQHADWYARDSQDQGHRKLPPLYPPSCAASAEHVVGASGASSSSRTSSQFFGPIGVERPKLRSQSLFDVFQPKRQRLQDGEEPSINYLSELESNQPLRPLVTDAQHFQFGTDPVPHAAGTLICCSSNCSGQTCSKIRMLIQKLASELIVLDSRVRSVLHSNTQSLKETPEVESVGTEKSLQWALDLVQWNNLKLQDHTERSVARTPEQGLYQGEPISTVGQYETMKRRQENIDRDEHSPSTRPPPGSLYEFPRLLHPAGIPEENRRSLYSGDLPPMSHSPHRTASSSGSIFIPPQSPLQASQTLRTGMLPSPSSMNFPTGPNVPPISPPSSSLQTSAQAAHLQDLQHQVSIKTLAFQTLQREYDSLLQKLERQRAKCATLEKKFEVSDVEINTLTDEKEKLQAQIAALETQVEELQKSRDEARHQLSANGAQYMRIMEMASRLQAQGAEDKKRWEAEKVELERRIKLLEEAMVTGAERPDAFTQAASQPFHPASAGQAAVSTTTAPTTPTLAPSAETMAVLRAEIARLRSRTQSMETALQTMRDESISIQAAAQSLVSSGRKVKEAVDNALGG